MRSVNLGIRAHQKYLFISDSNLFQRFKPEMIFMRNQELFSSMFKQINFLGRKVW